jgi:hypothetical protein
LRSDNFKWLCTTIVCNKPEPELETDVAILATVHDALTWRHNAEPSDENGKWIRLGTVIYPAEAKGLSRVLSAQDVRADPRDPRDTLWEDYARILEDMAGYGENCQPSLVADDLVREISEVELEG